MSCTLVTGLLWGLVGPLAGLVKGSSAVLGAVVGGDKAQPVAGLTSAAVMPLPAPTAQHAQHC